MSHSITSILMNQWVNPASEWSAPQWRGQLVAVMPMLCEQEQQAVLFKIWESKLKCCDFFLLTLLLLLLCSFDASSWPQLNLRGSSNREGVAVVKPSCISGFDEHEGPGTAPSVAPDGPSSMASSVWACPQQPASIFSVLHIESFRGVFFFGGGGKCY